METNNEEVLSLIKNKLASIKSKLEGDTRDVVVEVIGIINGAQLASKKKKITR